MAPVIAQMSPASQGEGQLLKHPLKPVANFLRGCLKSPDSRQILSSMCSLQLPESWHEACSTFCELGIGRTFKHPLTCHVQDGVGLSKVLLQRFDRFGRTQNSQVDLALLSFALHFFHDWQRPSASAYYKSPAFPGYFLFD